MDLTSNGPPASYIFPILRSQDIVECISELEIELSSQELTEPSRHKEKLRTIWLRLVRRPRRWLCCSRQDLACSNSHSMSNPYFTP
jgi:hypothetical protein